MHQKNVNPQEKVNESISLPFIRHDKDIITLINEIDSLNLVFQSLLDVQLMNKEDTKESTIETTY